MTDYCDTAENGLHGWSNCTLAVPAGAPLVNGVSEGPYWVDPNHAPPGAGYLNLIAYAYRTGFSGGVLPNVSMSGKKIVFDVTIGGISLPSKALLGVWLQASDPLAQNGQGRMVNIFQKNNTLCSQLGLVRPFQRGGSTGWIAPTRHTLEVPFTSDPRDWVSLGSSAARSNMYGHVEHAAGYKEVLDNYVDLGVICLLGAEPSPGLLGKFTFHKISIEDC